MASDYGVSRDELTDVLRATATPDGGNHALLFGARGTGKTSAACEAALPNQQVYSVTLTAEQPSASLWGHYVPAGKEFVWQDGPVLQAWRNGGLLVINEIDHASEDVSNLLHVALDDPGVAAITLPTGETVHPSAGFRCIATMNGRPEDLADAVLDRFEIATPVDAPSSAMLNALPEDLRNEAQYQYSHLSSETGEACVTYRELRAFARFRNVADEQTAASLALAGDTSRVNLLLNVLHNDPESAQRAIDAKRASLTRELEKAERNDPWSDRVYELEDEINRLRYAPTEWHVTWDAVSQANTLTAVNRDQVDSLISAVSANSNALLFGPRGTGKTTIAVRSAAKGQQVYSITLTGEQSAASLWGHYVPQGDELVWQDGPVLQAWRNGGLLVVNEIDHASEDVSNLLHVALDDPKVAQITLPTKETVRPAPGFRCVATMNGLPGDLAPAVLDRFDAVTPIMTPSKQMYDKLPKDLRKLAQEQYSKIDPSTGDVNITYRELASTARLSAMIGDKEAVAMVFGTDMKKAEQVYNAMTWVPKRKVSPIARDDLEQVLSKTSLEEGGDHVLLLGPRGTGKTTAAVKAARKGQKVYEVTLTAEQSAASLWGHYIPKGNEFVWQDGPVLQAWRNGGMLVINEIDHASEDVSNLLHVVLDDPSVASVTLPTKETVHPGKGFRCIATMNGQSDDLAPAVVDRFTGVVVVNEPSKQMIERLPKDVQAFTRYLYTAANPDQRGAVNTDWMTDKERKDQPPTPIDPTITYRDVDAFCQLRQWVPEEEAAYMAVDGDRNRAVAMVEAVRMQRAKEGLPAPVMITKKTAPVAAKLVGQAQALVAVAKEAPDHDATRTLIGKARALVETGQKLAAEMAL